MLRFLGRGSAFADEHNSAFFEDGRDLVIIDFSMTSFQKFKHFDLSRYDHVYILVTHTHGDHISGIGLLIDLIFFTTKTPVTVLAPSEAVREGLMYYLSVLEGCGSDWYELTTCDKIDRPWLKYPIPTIHTESLEGKCFGYRLIVESNNVIFTGDTATLDTFKRYIEPGTYLYTEASAYRSPVHINCEDIHDTLKSLSENGVHVYLMHMDDEEKILSVLADTGALPAPLYDD